MVSRASIDFTYDVSKDVRYAGVIWLLFLFRHLYLIGVWLGEDRRTNTTKTHVYKRLDYDFKFGYLLHTR